MVTCNLEGGVFVSEYPVCAGISEIAADSEAANRESLGLEARLA